MKLEIRLLEGAPKEYPLYVKAYYDDEIEQLRLKHPSDVELFKRLRGAKAVERIVFDEGRVYRLITAKLGKRDHSHRQEREEIGAAIWDKIKDGNEDCLLLDISNLGNEGVDLLTGLSLASWSFDKYQTSSKKNIHLNRIDVFGPDSASFRENYALQFAKVQGILYARELTSEPPNQLPPLAYAKRLSELEALGVKVKVLDQAAIEALGMTALLAVSQGSGEPPAVVVLEWNGTSRSVFKAPIALVGKGVCFDAGGICLKQAAHQYDMKWDKAGAGVVAGMIKALAIAKVDIHVVGILGLVENMPDGKAMKPGDVIRSASSKTIEIMNTDAEGRLVLADCLWYVQKEFSPSHIIDLGTLTMETFAALGTAYAGLYSNDRTLAGQLIAAGEKSGDLLWELPMGPYFAKQIESTVADIKNLGVESWGENGAAAEFLRCFIQKDTPWAHIDIAGVSWTKEDLPTSPKGVTGFGVKVLLEWLLKDVT